MSDQEEHQQPAVDNRPRRVKKKKVAAKKKPQDPETPPPAERPKGRPKLSLNDKQQVDYIRTATSGNVWYYRDRMNVARGPCNLPVLKECWVHGVIDDQTLVWGQGLVDFLPIRNIRTLVPQIRTLEVQVATWVKRNFALRPALNKIRKQRAEHRDVQSDQVDRMY